jgi:hypothetical protein
MHASPGGTAADMALGVSFVRLRVYRRSSRTTPVDRPVINKKVKLEREISNTGRVPVP